MARGGRFCLSDDSHGIDQVGLNFHRVLDFLDKAGISSLHYLTLAEPSATATVDARFPRTQTASVSIDELKDMAFWKST